MIARRRCWITFLVSFCGCFLALKIYYTDRNLDLKQSNDVIHMDKSVSNQEYDTNIDRNIINQELNKQVDNNMISRETKTEVNKNLICNESITYKNCLAAVASPNKSVLLTLVDEAFYDMAINFYLTSIKPHNLNNFLILTMHKKTCSHLTPFGINCFFYKDIGSTETASKWGTQIFKDKMNVRTDMIIDALNYGFSVLHTDIDMYFYSNPFDSINCLRDSCDIATLMDTFAYNAGFLLIHPSSASKEVYKYMKKLSKSHPGMDDQAQLNKSMKRQQGQKGGLKIVKLSQKQFLCGKTYYEDPKRYFADSMKPCPECVVVHNNWIVSREAKIYRAKECHQWLYDGEDQYYTSGTRKYIMYENPIATESSDEEIKALQNAFAFSDILKRTLILPKFHCKTILCPLNSILRVQSLDKVFGYRESTFLTNPVVPEPVKSSLSPVYYIASDYMKSKTNDSSKNPSIVEITPKDTANGLTEKEIIELFGNNTQSVLRFHSMYYTFASFSDSAKSTTWAKSLKDGFVKAGYRQYNK